MRLSNLHVHKECMILVFPLIYFYNIGWKILVTGASVVQYLSLTFQFFFIKIVSWRVLDGSSYD